MTDNLNLAEWVSAAFTAVIAVATVYYVVYTRHLWHETRASVLVKPNDSERTASNGGNYKIEIQAAYFSPNGQCRWKYRAVRALTPPFTFAMDPQVPDREERLK